MLDNKNLSVAYRQNANFQESHSKNLSFSFIRKKNKQQNKQTRKEKTVVPTRYRPTFAHFKRVDFYPQHVMVE